MEDNNPKIVLEIIGSHDCNGNVRGIPDLLSDLINNNEAYIRTHIFKIWDLKGKEILPVYIKNQIRRIRKGVTPNTGLFLDGNWFPLNPHNPNDTINAVNHIKEKLGIKDVIDEFNSFAQKLNLININHNNIKNITINDRFNKNIGGFCNHIKTVTFFDGRINNLNINCAVDNFYYSGYDMKKLLKLVREHSHLFEDAKIRKEQISIDDINIQLLTSEQLTNGYHPCVINGNRINKSSKFHEEVTKIFGGWGYVAMHLSKPIGFIGISPKILLQRDVSGIPPDDVQAEKTLNIICIAGGGVFGYQYHNIGVASKLVKQIIEDAKQRGYQYLEGNPHDFDMSYVFKKFGFERIEWNGGGTSPQREQSFYRLKLNLNL